MKQQCNDAVFVERKEIVKTPAPEDKKDQQQNHVKPTGSVHEIQTEAAAPTKGRRRKEKKGGSDNSQNEPHFWAADNIGYQQVIQGGPSKPQQQQHYYPPPPPQYPYQDMPQCNVCPWALDWSAYTNFQLTNYSVPNNYFNYQLNNCSSFSPNYTSGPNECFRAARCDPTHFWQIWSAITATIRAIFQGIANSRTLGVAIFNLIRLVKPHQP